MSQYWSQLSSSLLKSKYQTQRSRFTQTGSGVDPTDPQVAANLHEDVLRHLPTYDDLNELWRTIPSYAPKAFSSDPQVDHSSRLLSIVHTKSAPASTSSAISHLGPDGGDANELDGDHSQDLPPPSTEQPPSIADNDDQFNYDMLDDGAVDEEVNASGGEMNADDDEDYDMAGHETGNFYDSRVEKRPRPFSPSPPPESTILPMMSPHTPVADSRASFATHASRAIERTSLSKHRRLPPSVASSTISSSAWSSSGSIPSHSPITNTSFSTKVKSIKHVRSDIASVHDKAQLLAQGVVAEHYSAKADQKMLKLQIHEKKWDQMHSLSKQLIEQSSSLLEHQRTLESKNADIRLEQAKAQTFASKMELLRLKLQLGEQQLQLQNQQRD
ncbi:hypothetical protein F4604DRAFT_1689129 [Suillus subluteus]|nr:hypothetical protein F4604DRAFT_1689129 [Suillus subluteus]